MQVLVSKNKAALVPVVAGWVIAGLSVLAGAGCQDHTPPPMQAGIPPVGMYSDDLRTAAPKPLPTPEVTGYQPPYTDEPLVTQPLPEQAFFVDAYNHVGRPRISLFVNRSLEGRIIPTNQGGPVASVENTRETNGAIKMEQTRSRVDAWGRPIDEKTDRFETSGPARVTDRTEVYLAPGQYDEGAAKRVDYDAVENILTDWLAASGRVSMISAKLSESQIKDLQQGRRNVLNELSKDNQIDVLIQVQAHATRQTERGLEVRLVAEAMNTQGGESLARAVVDIPPPLEKRAINEYTRYLARKLMNDMGRTWNNPAPVSGEPVSREPASNNAPPTTQP